MSEKIRIKKKNHAYLQIDTDDRGVLAELSEFFTFKVPGAEFMPAYKNRVWDGKIRLVSNTDNTIYAGLYDYIKAFAEAEGRGYEIADLDHPMYGPPRSFQDADMSFVEDIPLSSKGNPIRPRDYQLEAVEHGIKNKRAMLLSPTASGKSLIIYLMCRWYMDNHNGRILIVVPTTSLVEQMYSDFADYSETDDTFDSESIVHKIYGGKEKTTQTKYKITTEDGKKYTFHGNEYIKIINSNIEWKLAKDITEKDEIDDTWLQS